jgi:hypothetical protein
MIDEDDFWSNWWNKIWQGKPKYSKKTPQLHAYRETARVINYADSVIII